MNTLLKKHLAEKAEHLPLILEASVSIITSTNNPLRFSFAALGLRELLREFFAVVSPDAEVMSAKWHKIVDSDYPVTRRDRILFSVYSHLDPSFFAEEIGDLASDLVKKIDTLSKCLHITPKVLAIPDSTLQSDFDSALALFDELIKNIASKRASMEEELTNRLDEKLTEIFCEEFFDDLDCLSTHTRPQSAEYIEVTIDSIDADFIRFSGTGSVLCDLQFGSDGDCRRGDGVEFSDSYPFTFSGISPVTNPLDAEVLQENIRIDTSSCEE